MQKSRRYIFLIAAQLLLSQLLYAQSDSFRVIKGLPTNEVYDLMFDAKGLLWIGHDLGLSSFDGLTLKHYSNASQTSKAITGMVADKKGRVWCYNFSGQIFWVKDGVMHLLKEYDASNELAYPRLAICKNELIASSDFGFFVYNLETDKARYVPLGGPIRSLAVVGDYVYATTTDNVCSYSTTAGVTKVPIEDVIPGGKNLRLTLQAQSRGDTVFTITNPLSLCHRFVAKNGKLKLVDILHVGNFINDVTCNGEEAWIHTKTKSMLIGSEKEITGYNLTDIVADKEGNYWYSSLKYGVMVKPRAAFEKVQLDLALQKNDYIRCVSVLHKKIFYGTQMGKVYMQDVDVHKTKCVFSEKNGGAIEFMVIYDSSHIAICSPVSFFLLNTTTQAIKTFDTPIPIKDISVNQDYALLSGTLLILVPDLLKPYSPFWKDSVMKIYPTSKRSIGYDGPVGNKAFDNWNASLMYWSSERCRSAVFFPFTNTILASFKSGLQEMKPYKQPKQLLFKGKQIETSKLLVYKEKVFIASVFGNLLAYDKSGLREVSASGGISTESILRLFLVDNQVYILTTDGVCVLDADTETVIGYSELLGLDPGSILDIKRIDGKVTLITDDGIYNPSSSIDSMPVRPVISLSYAIANGKDTLQSEGQILSHKQSDIRFYLSAPWYTNTSGVYIAYRLLGNNDTSWQYTSRTDQPVYYASLPSGDYTFETKAVHRLTNKESTLVSYQFTILKAWWQELMFQLFALVSMLLLVTYLIRRYYLVRLYRQKRFYEDELAVEKERERISADIHDELGGTLSGIKLMTEMTGRKHTGHLNVSKELNDIHMSVMGLTKKMREVIWSLSNENNTLDNLLDYLLRRGKEMFVNSSIQFHSELPKFIPSVQLKGETRRHIYLAVKEALHNALKHSEANDVYLIFTLDGNVLCIQIKDTGKGFSDGSMQHINGLKNMKFRMQQISGDIKISTTDGVDIIFSIPIV